MATYVIKSGDTLSKIAAANGTTVGALQSANGISNPNLIVAGKALTIPSAAPVKTTTVANSTPSTALKPLPSSSIVGLSNTANSTPAYIIPNTPAKTPAVSIYPQAPSTAITTPAKSTPSVTATPSVPAPVASPAPAGGSIVDYLNSKGQASTYAARAALAASHGIANYTGTAAQNTALLAAVSGGAPAGGGYQAPTVTPPAGTVTPPDANALALAAGKAGLSVSEYQSLLAGNTIVSSAEQKKIADELGISDAEAAAFAKPSKSTQEVYDGAYKNAGLDALHAKIATLIDSINTEKGQATDAVGAVNENPFLTETSRVGRGKRIEEQLQAKIGNDTDLLTQLQDLYTQGVTEVNNLVARTSDDFKNNQTTAQQYLNYLQTKAQQQADLLKSDKTITASNSASDYLQGVASAKATAAANAAAKTANASPNLVGSASTGYYRWDASTRSFVQVIKGTGGSSGFAPTSAQKATVAGFLNSADGKALTGGAPVTQDDLDSIFSDETTFYSLLSQANGE